MLPQAQHDRSVTQGTAYPREKIERERKGKLPWPGRPYVHELYITPRSKFVLAWVAFEVSIGRVMAVSGIGHAVRIVHDAYTARNRKERVDTIRVTNEVRRFACKIGPHPTVGCQYRPLPCYYRVPSGETNAPRTGV